MSGAGPPGTSANTKSAAHAQSTPSSVLDSAKSATVQRRSEMRFILMNPAFCEQSAAAAQVSGRPCHGWRRFPGRFQGIGSPMNVPLKFLRPGNRVDSCRGLIRQAKGPIGLDFAERIIGGQDMGAAGQGLLASRGSQASLRIDAGSNQVALLGECGRSRDRWDHCGLARPSAADRDRTRQTWLGLRAPDAHRDRRPDSVPFRAR